MLVVFFIDANYEMFSWYNLTAILIVSVLHFLIDRFIKPILNQLFKQNQFFTFLTDQIIHFLIIIITAIQLTPDYWITKIWDSLYGFTVVNPQLVNALTVPVVFILLTTFTGQLIAKLFINLNKETEVESEEVKIIKREVNGVKEVVHETTIYPIIEVNDYGKWIGYVERILIFMLVFLGVYEGIVIVVGLKTFARFKQLNQKNFVEKYLLGTLFSVMMAVLLGIIFSLIIN